MSQREYGGSPPFPLTPAMRSYLEAFDRLLAARRGSPERRLARRDMTVRLELMRAEAPAARARAAAIQDAELGP